MLKAVWGRAGSLVLAALLLAWNCGSAPGQEDALIKVKITAGFRVLQAEFLDNATARSLVEKFPLTVPMRDLYAREMCYRFPEALPAPEARRSGCEAGDTGYWTPGHSLVIFI